MADVKTTLSVLSEAEHLDSLFRSVLDPAQAESGNGYLFEGIRAEADHKRRVEDALIALTKSTESKESQAPATKGVDQSSGERDLTKWFRETWKIEGCLNGTAFFNLLKKYVNQPNSPIREHYTTGPKGAGIRWTTGSASNNMTKKNIQTMVSKFKKQARDKSCQ